MTAVVSVGVIMILFGICEIVFFFLLKTIQIEY